MNQPLTPVPVTELEALIDAFEGVLVTLPNAYSTQDRSHERLADASTTVAGLAVRLNSQRNRTLTALGAAAPASRMGHANTASSLTVAIGNVGRALNEMAAAQDAHLFIDHFPTRYGNPETNSSFARDRINAHLDTARNALTEAAEKLRHTAQRRATEERLRAARARGSQKAAPTIRDSAAPATPTPSPAKPTTSKSR